MTFRVPRILLILSILSIPTSILSPCRAAEVSTDARYLDGLRQRELFELAETYARQRLAEDTLSPRDRARLTIQQARTFSQHAAAAPPAEQTALWQQAEGVLDTWLAAEPDSPWRPLVAMQRALVALARGEFARHQAQLATQADPHLAEARAQLRASIGRLRPLVDEVDRMLAVAERTGPRGTSAGSPQDISQAALSADELISLGRNVRYQLARALLAQAQCYDRQSADRAHSLTQATAWLDQLAGLPQNDSLVWKSRLARVECYRLLSDYASAARALDEIDQQQPPRAVALRARTEAIRLALDQGQLDRALALLQLPDVLARLDQPNWDLARLEVSLAAWQAAGDRGDPELAGQWQTRANELVRQIESRHGAYWSRRAEMLLAGALRRAAGSGDPDTLARAARSAYLSGQLDEAIGLYEQAAARAAAAGNPQQALDSGYLAAAILQKQGRYDQAAERCRRWSLALAGQPRAAEVHLEAIRNLAQAIKDRPDAALDDYGSLLEEHLARWSASSTTGEARWLLGGVRRYQRDWDRAIAAYQGIGPADPRLADAIDAVGTCYKARLAELRADHPAAEALAARGTAWFESILDTAGGSPIERLSPAQRRVVLWAARMRLASADYGKAQRRLTAALAEAPDAPDDWRREAEALSVVALAGAGQADEAGRMVERLATAPPTALLNLVDQLDRLAQAAPTPHRQRLANLQLQVVDLVGRRQSELSPDQRLAFHQAYAGALVASGRGDEALEKYATLARAHPDDAKLGEAYAELLATRGDRWSLAAALAEWRRIERRAKPGGGQWFRAKYAVAELNLRLGRPERAEKIIELLALLHPELGGPAMKPRFEQLLQQAKQRGLAPSPR